MKAGISQHGQAEMTETLFQTTLAVKVTAKFILEQEEASFPTGVVGCDAEQQGDFCPHLTH